MLVQQEVEMDGTTSKEEIAAELLIIHAGRAFGNSCMQLEHLKMCLREAT